MPRAKSARSPKPQASGGARLVASGRIPMTLGWLPAERKILEAAAAKDGRKMTQFVKHHALMAAITISGIP